MLPQRYAHFLFALIQSGLTTAIAAAITIWRMGADGALLNWVSSWLTAWVTMVPVVILAAPAIRWLSHYLTTGKSGHRAP
ncbi:DUF2798 domain-containing protein [Bradyrhizobium sp. 180]|uniref:DUF2798 domain-containing protein n=1 Tax=unclassified Bradyrhizobium TaxID=2631580 RepID=UPI001FF881F4|nr:MULTISPECIES: DUF2798 domain-containing protein [unclassified Bradyrhizobium]MCK1492161.1 DUF2798 domain-containing protein [Bradyrhizobium sp. 180]MCK1719514.1 DUF2798 domain-containing protein [Bradyrhizobium sp. 141]